MVLDHQFTIKIAIMNNAFRKFLPVQFGTKNQFLYCRSKLEALRIQEDEDHHHHASELLWKNYTQIPDKLFLSWFLFALLHYLHQHAYLNHDEKGIDEQLRCELMIAGITYFFKKILIIIPTRII
jgi:hypothetical protein